MPPCCRLQSRDDVPSNYTGTVNLNIMFYVFQIKTDLCLLEKSGSTKSHTNNVCWKYWSYSYDENFVT